MREGKQRLKQRPSAYIRHLGADATPGSRFEMAPNGGGLLGEGENIEVDPPRRLVQTMRALWGEDVKAEGTSRITWEIESVGDSCHLTVTTTSSAKAPTTSSTAAGR